MDEGVNVQGIEELSLDPQHTDYDVSEEDVSVDDDNYEEQENDDEEEEPDMQDEDAEVQDDVQDEDAEEEGMGNLTQVDFYSITPDDIKGMEFGDVESAYAFYNEYGKVNGFSVRKNKRGKNKNDEITWQQFVCSSEGFCQPKYIKLPNRQREHTVLTRFGGEAEMRISFDVSSGRWLVSRCFDEHSHKLLGDKFIGLLRSHKKLSDADIAQVDSMRKSGISIPKIFGSFASQSGGYDKIGFGEKEMYNWIQKERKKQGGDVKEAAKFLRELRRKDPTLFWSHKAGVDGRLLHLFWCDGTSQLDYVVFPVGL